MGTLNRALEALGDRRLGKLRKKHIKHGHPHFKSTHIDKLTSDKHPRSDNTFVYTVNVMRCSECGLYWNDSGLEFRKEENNGNA